MLQLVIGNKNYSSWSLRPWLLMREAGIDFEEVMVPFGSAFHGAGDDFGRRLGAISPAGRVPVLIDDGFVVWDTLAIAEYLAERFPDRALWPADPRQRARARSLCAEMHSGFAALRSSFNMNIEVSMPEVGERLLRERPEARADLERIVAMWREQLAAHGGPWLFGERLTIADSYYAPVCSRIRSYALPVPPEIGAYVERVFALPGMQQWVRDALAEQQFVPSNEPYRSSR